MEKSFPASSLTPSSGALNTGGADGTAASVNLLLVTCSPAWTQAVLGAAEEIGDGRVANCRVRDAIMRLAGMSAQYSHVLVDEGSADGLFDTLAEMTTEIAEPDTDMLALGLPEATRKRIRVEARRTQAGRRLPRSGNARPPGGRTRRRIGCAYQRRGEGTIDVGCAAGRISLWRRRQRAGRCGHEGFGSRATKGIHHRFPREGL